MMNKYKFDVVTQKKAAKRAAFTTQSPGVIQIVAGNKVCIL